MFSITFLDSSCVDGKWGGKRYICQRMSPLGEERGSPILKICFSPCMSSITGYFSIIGWKHFDCHLRQGCFWWGKKKCEGNNAHVTYAWIRRCYWWVREEHQTNLFCFWHSGPKLEILGAHAEYFGSHIVNLQISSYYSCIHSFIHSLRFLFFRFSGVGFAGGSIISSDAQTSGVILRSSREK